MSEKFTLNILGSASAKPSLYRESSAQLLQADEHLFLIDCSEGTQRRILSQARISREWAATNHVQGLKRLSRSSLNAIFISHTHGDHMFGLFPLLNTMAMNGRTKPLYVFGPNNLGPILTFYKSYWGVKDPYELNFQALKMKEPELIMETRGLQVKAFPLNHGVDCFGFIFMEKEPCSHKGQAFAPRSYAYCSDTAPFPELPEWVKGVDLLYHEATYMTEDARKASSRMHSTTEEAANCALAAGAGKLLIGHYSSAIKEEQIQTSYLAQAREIFPNSFAVQDGDIFDLPVSVL